jgi:hypothetical protein
LAPPLAHVVGATQTHPTFRASPKRQLVQVSRRRPPVGTIFKYNLDIGAAVRLDFTQPGSGRTVNGKCVALDKRNKRKYALFITAITPAVGATSQTLRFTVVR